MKFYKTILKAIPVTILVLAIGIYKFRYKLNLVKPTVVIQEAIDSSYLNNVIIKPSVASGTLMDKSFNGFDASRFPIAKAMDSGMSMINNDQFYIIKLYDEKGMMELYIAIRDLKLLKKIPFSYSFENGTKVLVTAFLRNKDGVNAMYGGTIHNNRGKLKLSHYNEETNLVSGELEADLDAVIENGICDVRNLKFNNVILQHNKVD